MRVLHTSDWHLGQELYGYDRGPEHDVFLDWLIDQLAANQIDVLLITGDIYDVANPPVEAQQRFYRFLNRTLTSSPHLQIVAIGGNHDSATRVELPKELLDSQRVSLIGCIPRRNGRPEATAPTVALRDESGKIKAVCACVPYLRPGDLPARRNGGDPVAEVYASAIDAARTQYPGVPLIVTGHLHVAGAAISEFSERRIFVGGEEAVSAEVFPSNVAYVALGHLHKPQTICTKPLIRYAGSPFPLSATERTYEHSIVVLDFSSPTVHSEILRTPRPAAFLRVPETGAIPISTLETALSQLTIDCPDERFRPYLEIGIRMDGPVPDLRRRIDIALQGKPVRVTRITREADESQLHSDRVPTGASLSELDPLQVFVTRYQRQYESEPPEPLRQRFLEICAAAQADDAPGPLE